MFFRRSADLVTIGIALARPKAAEIRDAAIDLINGLGILKALRKVPTFQWQPEDQTACGVYLLRENKTALGDFNAGEPSFETEATIGISVLVRVEDPNFLADATDQYTDPIERALLTDPAFVSMTEGVRSITRNSAYPPNGSAYMSETRMEIEFGYQELWPPLVPDDYRKTVIVTKPVGDDPDAPELRTVIDIAQD